MQTVRDLNMQSKALSIDYLHMTSTPVNGKTRLRGDMATPSGAVPNMSKICVSCCVLNCAGDDSSSDEWDFSHDKSPDHAVPTLTSVSKRPEFPSRPLVRMRSVEQIEMGVVETLRREEADVMKRNDDLIRRLCGSLQNCSEIQEGGSPSKVKDSRWKKVKVNLKSIKRILKKETSSTQHRSTVPDISEPISIPAGTVTPSKVRLLPLAVVPHAEETQDQGMDSGCFVSPDLEFPRTVLKDGKQCTYC